MALLGKDDEEADAARSWEAEDREMPLHLCTEVAVKTGAKGPQGRVGRQMEERIREQLRDMLATLRRAPFSGPVAIAIELAVPAERNPPSVRRVTKRYIDILKDFLFDDDRDIRHLIAWQKTHKGAEARVTAQILPLDLFEADYDRAFRFLGHEGALATVLPGVTLQTATMRNGAPIPEEERAPWGLLPFTIDDLEIMEHHRGLLHELVALDEEEQAWDGDPDDWWPSGDLMSTHPEFNDPLVRAQTRAYLQSVVASELGRELTDNGFDARDRTGEVDWLERLDRGVDVLELEDRGPGCFTVEASAGERGTTYRSWSKEVEAEVRKAVAEGRWAHATFEGDVVIDVAVPAVTPEGDLDNVAGFVFSAVEAALGNQRAERLVGYRAYRQHRGTSIRVRLLPAIRLEALQRAMTFARQGGLALPREPT